MSNSLARAAPPGVVVISKNLHRRQLKDAEVIMIAAKVANLRRGGDRGNQHTGGKVHCLTGRSLVRERYALVLPTFRGLHR